MIRAFVLALCSLVTIAAQAETVRSCQSASFNADLKVFDNFEQELGAGLTFRIKTGADPAWTFDIVPSNAASNDYIYPVNFPLRFNASQYLGPAYGEDVKASLSHPHEVRFVLDRADYERVSSLVGNVLWPYQTSDPDGALASYMNAVKNAKKGWLTVKALSYKTDPKTDALTDMALHVQVTTPQDFVFASGLKPKPASCPPDED